MKILSTSIPSDPAHREWWYNAMDCAMTSDILHKLEPQIPRAQLIYNFERALQGPALSMMQRGVLIDQAERSKQIGVFTGKMLEYQDILNELAYAVWGKPINPNSPKQLCDFFYNELKLPVQYKFNKLTKEKTPSTDRAAMEKLTLHWVASPFVNLIGELRDASKKLSVLRRGIGDDGRMRCSYNVTGTETGRWSSNQSVWGDGTNLQNITESLRKMFVADPGKVLIYADGEQAESRLVGAIIFKLFGDSLYLDACEEGDLHTTVTKLVWKTLGWTSDAKRDRLIAEAPFYRHFSYRDMAKRGGHGTNYRGSAFVMAQHLKVPRPLIEAFQLDYFNAFPGIPRWHRHRQAELLRKPEMTTLFGRTRQFFGRPSDDHTLKEAIAFEPQSCVGDLINEGMLRVWNQRKPLGFDLLMQVHDNIIGQVDYDEHLPRKVAAIKELFAVPFDVSGRTIVIPSEIKTGWNWGNFDATRNPDGLKKWTGSEQRRRLEDPEASVLDRVLY